MTQDDWSPEEKEAVEELRRRMEGQMDNEMFSDDNLFIRFTRARSLNINAAEAMLRNHINWRNMIQVDTILTNYTIKEVFTKYMTLNVIGFDKDGSPIFYSQFGNVDTKGFIKSAKRTEIVKAIVHCLESGILAMKENNAKTGKSVDKLTCIFNFENFSFATATHKATLEILSSLVGMYEANYPERLKSAYFINASLYFTIAFAVIKPFLSAPTVKKINIFGKDGWKEELLKVFGSDVLPAFLGGSRTDPDGNPLCKSVICHGGPVPEKYFVYKKEKKHFAQQPGIRKLIITRMSKAELTLEVLYPGWNIEWEFETKSRDIGFSLLYKENRNEPKAKELVPKQRIDTMLSAETGMFQCDRPGIYILEFDNTYSWIFQKEVYCKTSVVNPSVITAAAIEQTS